MALIFPRGIKQRWLAAAGLSTLVASGAWAQEFAGVDRLPEPQRFGQISIISGGVDIGQAELMRKAQARYPLRVVFSVRGSGAYAIPDEFRVMKGGEVIADLPGAGPWLLIDLPPGSYKLQSVFEGQATERAVRVGAQGQTVHWVAPQGID
jgi:hypothetical protein